MGNLTETVLKEGVVWCERRQFSQVREQRQLIVQLEPQMLSLPIQAWAVLGLELPSSL